MTTDIDAYTYAQRAVRALGQEAHDPEKMAIWCYDHPPRKALPKLEGERSRNVYISRRVYACLLTLSKSMQNGQPLNTTDALADSLLALSVKDLAPAAWIMHERHEQEEKAMLDRLRYEAQPDSCEPEFQPQEEAPFNEIPR